MNFDNYQSAAKLTAVYPKDVALAYLSLGLGNEAGEAQGKIKKYLRGDYDMEALKEKLEGELGDVLWYLAVLADSMGLSLDTIAQANIAKLHDRAARGKLKGDGDTR